VLSIHSGGGSGCLDDGPFPVAGLPELPGRDGQRVTPEPDPGSTRLQFNPGEVTVPGVSLEVPCVTRMEEFLIEATAPHVNPGNESAVAIPVHGADLHFLAESEIRRETVGPITVCLMFLGAVDAVETDFYGPAVLENGNRIPVGDSADASGPPAGRGCKEKHKAQNRQDQPIISLHSFDIGRKLQVLISISSGRTSAGTRMTNAGGMELALFL
jgi:hypothetical protein